MPAMPSPDTMVIRSPNAAMGAMISAAPSRIVPAPTRMRNKRATAAAPARALSAEQHRVGEIDEQAGLAIAAPDRPTHYPGQDPCGKPLQRAPRVMPACESMTPPRGGQRDGVDGFGG